MTTVNPPTSDGGQFEPLTLIRAEEMNDELDAINYDLNYVTGVLQAIYDKLDTIEPGAGATLDSDQIIALINLGSSKINVERLSEDVSSGGDVTVAIANHRSTTTQAYMHPETSIKSTELSYSSTPTSYITSPTSLLDELKNLRYAVHKVIGRTTWVDTPTENLTQLTAALDVVQSKLAGIENNATADMSASEILTAIKTVDGSSSGLDSDLLDGQHGSYYTPLTSLTAHTSNTNNPHSTTKTHVGLSNVLNVQQFPASNVETGAGLNGLTTWVPSSYTVNKAIRAAFGEGGNAPWVYKQNSSAEGGQLNFETANASTYPDALYIDRTGSDFRFVSERGAYDKVVMVPQMRYSGINSTTNMMSVGELNWSTSVANNYWSSSGPGTVSNAIIGPVMITGGLVSRASSYSFVEYNTGSGWTQFAVTDMAAVPQKTNNAQMGPIPSAFVPAGVTLQLRAGSTFSGSSSYNYGGAYVLHYVRV